MKFCPQRLTLLERGENNLFEIDRELRHTWIGADIRPCVADICDAERISAVFADDESVRPTSHPGIRVWQLPRTQRAQVQQHLALLTDALKEDRNAAIAALSACVPEYHPDDANQAFSRDSATAPFRSPPPRMLSDPPSASVEAAESLHLPSTPSKYRRPRFPH